MPAPSSAPPGSAPGGGTHADSSRVENLVGLACPPRLPAASARGVATPDMQVAARHLITEPGHAPPHSPYPRHHRRSTSSPPILRKTTGGVEASGHHRGQVLFSNLCMAPGVQDFTAACRRMLRFVKLGLGSQEGGVFLGKPGTRRFPPDNNQHRRENRLEFFFFYFKLK